MWLLAISLTFRIEQLANGGTVDSFSANLKPETPHYLINLNLNEFMFLSLAEVDGILNYGGSGEFRIKLSRVGSEAVWSVTINDPRFLDLVGIFVGERTMKVESLSPKFGPVVKLIESRSWRG